MAARSTAEGGARRRRGAAGRATAAIGTRLAADLYGLEVLATDIEDHDDNATRFVLVARPEHGIPAPTGHDKTSIVCFQSDDRPGSLHGILGQFSARNLNLTKLESRPTKRGLGDYCFIIDFEGHVDDEVVADCLRDLHATLRRAQVPRLLPGGRRARPGPPARRRGGWRAADEWIVGRRGPDPTRSGSARGVASPSIGGMAERPNARLLKSLGMQVPVGSNPTPSAGQRHFLV